MPPTFDLVVATVGRTEELRGLLASLDRQTHREFRVIVVDQNDDERIADVARWQPGVTILRLRADRGLSVARNAALDRIASDVVAFPDDDCRYGDDLLMRVAHRLTTRPDLDGIVGRTQDEDGRSSANWATEPGPVLTDNVWHRSNSNSIFLRRRVVESVGSFDEALGLGARTPWESGEDTDYLVRAVLRGARIEYDPDLVVIHPEKELGTTALRSLRRRDGASVGYILAKHGYPLRAKARMLARPAGGAALSLVRGDVEGARLHAEVLRGRALGLHGGSTERRAAAVRRRR
jgi:glycosyltransferase involved in cell wall biosynthesis